MICFGPVCIPIQAFYGVLPVLYLLWDRIRPKLSEWFPGTFPPIVPEGVDQEAEAKLIEALPAAALENLRKGGDGGMYEIEDASQWEEELQKSAESGMPLVVDFGGKFCKPCKAIKPFVVELSKEFLRCRFVYIDVDAVSEVALDKYAVVALPTFKVFKWGKEAATLTGVSGEELKKKLREMVSAHQPCLPGEGEEGKKDA